MTEQQENALNHLLEMVQSLDASAACDGANDCHPSIKTERIYDSLAIALRQAFTAPTLPLAAMVSDDDILQAAALLGIKIRTGGAAIKLCRAIIKADRALRQADPDLTIAYMSGRADGKRQRQAGQVPVAWMAHYTEKSGLQCVYTSSSYALAAENDDKGAPTPLYTAPPAASAPLTEGQIGKIMREASRGAATGREGTTSTRIARAVEQAHGIGTALAVQP